MRRRSRRATPPRPARPCQHHTASLLPQAAAQPHASKAPSTLTPALTSGCFSAQRLAAELQEKLRVAALEREERDAAEARAEAEAKQEPPEP